MTISEMFGQSGVLVVLGMSVVVLFLATLIFCITCLGLVARKFNWAKNEAGGSSSPSAAAKAAATGVIIDGSVVAAISAAVKEHRKE
ncbi:MAG: hypothetical protein Ta2B_04050 [Termitinemataceae bacterium]|nr:MAG: hypothetical protein Ta2B_04050 [Termitinemataceae bacterium]